MKCPVIFAFLLSVSAFAQDKDVLKIINDVNDRKLPQKAEKDCCGTNIDTPSAVNQCAIELCGKPTPDTYYAINDQNFEKYAKPDALKRFGEIENEVKELVQKEIKSNEALTSALRKNLNGQKIKINFSEWENSDYDDIAEKMFDQYIDITINKKLKPADRISIKVLPPAGASEAFKAGLNNYVSRIKFLAVRKPKDGMNVGLYTIDEARQLMNSEWASFFAAYSEKLKTDPEFMKPYQELIEQTKKDLQTKVDGPTKFSEILTYIDVYKTQFAEATKVPTASLSYCMDKACQKAVQEYLTKFNFKETLDNLSKENASSDLMEDKLLNCRSELASKNLLDDDLEKVATMMKDVKGRLMTKAAAGYSEHSRKELARYFEEINISLKNGSKNEDAFIEEIHKAYNESAGEEEEEEDQKSLILKLFTKTDESGETDPMGGTTYCNSLFATIWDAFGTKDEVSLEDGSDVDVTKNNLFLSKFSCVHVTAGSQVLAHELGHAMSYAFMEKRLSEQSLKGFLNLRACATSHYKRPSNLSTDPGLSFPGDKFRTEEDTADLISYLAYADAGLMECSLLDRNKAGTSYTDLSVKNSMEGDSHSSAMFRVLQEAVHKKKELPASCKKVIDENKDLGFNVCF